MTIERAEALSPSPRPARRILIPLVVACALFMENLDSTIIATSLPQMAQSLGESPLALNIALTSYLLSLAVFIPISGWMADRFGARTVFCCAIILFTLGSAFCGLAGALWQMVVARVLQGAGGAMMTPVGRMVLVRSFPKSALINAMSYVTIPALIGPTIGPLVGGAITTYLSWRWIFFVNIPVGAAGFGLALRYFDDFRSARQERFDVIGFALVAVGLAGLVLGLDFAGRRAISTGVDLAMIGASLVCLALYARHARSSRHPALDLALLRKRTFRIAVLGGSISRMGFGSVPFLLPLLFQLEFGLNPLESGSLTFVSSLGAMAMKACAPPIVRRLGFRTILIGNAAAIGLVMTSFALVSKTTPAPAILAVLGVFGFLRSLQFTCINALGYCDLAPAAVGRGTSLASVAQQITLSFGVALGATLLSFIMALSGSPGLDLWDFRIVFLVVALLPLASIPLFARLAPTDGAQVSGYRQAR